MHSEMNVGDQLQEQHQRRSMGLLDSVECILDEYKDMIPFNVTLQFVYEMAVHDPYEPFAELKMKEIPRLEYTVLYLVAQAADLRPCNLIYHNRTELFHNDTSSASAAIVTGLSSLTSDAMDDSNESCEFLIDLDPALKCIPLNATIKATYYGSEENRIEVEELLQSYIVNVMDVFNNSPEPIGGVFAAYFVGSRIQPEPLSTTRRGVDTNSSGFVILASGLAAVAIITMLFLYFFMARRRQKDEPNVLNTIEKREVLVPQAEESLRLPNLTMISDNSISTNQDNDVETPSNSKDRHTGSFAPPIVLLSGRTSSTDAMDSEDDDSHPNRQEDEIKRVSVLTPNKDEFKYMSTSTNENGPTVMVDANRPPKPPTISSTKALVPVSQPLKKRRKRRKKKKSPTIQRTKSRENIAGMETIDEGADEEATSGCNSVDDEDSEFSWYSSDSDPGSSRDPSPARSSREPSPARSTGSSGEASSAQAGVTKDGETVRNSRRLWI